MLVEGHHNPLLTRRLAMGLCPLIIFVPVASNHTLVQDLITTLGGDDANHNGQKRNE